MTMDRRIGLGAAMVATLLTLLMSRGARFEQLGRNAGPGVARRHRAGAAPAARPGGQGRAGGLLAGRRLRAGLWRRVERPGRRRLVSVYDPLQGSAGLGGP